MLISEYAWPFTIPSFAIASPEAPWPAAPPGGSLVVHADIT